ncbi:MAG: putative transport system permease protein [Acidimicrobiaceae bacterium]|jgi:putative ABC transport system permease protein
MWRVALADMRYRRRRFVITVLATGLMFAMTLLTSGAAEALHHQDRSIVSSFHADSWFVAAGGSGPFTTTTPLASSVTDEVARVPGVSRASPVVLFRATVESHGKQDVNVVATPPDGLGSPALEDGRQPRDSGDVVLDADLGIRVGASADVAGRVMRVVGIVNDARYYFGTPTIFMLLRDAQEQFFGGLPLVSAIAVQGQPRGEVAGLRQMSVSDVAADLKRPTSRGDATVQFINVLLWISAIGIVGSIVYLSAIERVREFAVMKATGVSNGSLLIGLAIQAIVLSVLAAMVAAVVAQLLAPGFPFAVRITRTAYVGLVVVAIVVGLLGSGAGLRRAVKVDPALAFGGV